MTVRSRKDNALSLKTSSIYPASRTGACIFNICGISTNLKTPAPNNTISGLSLLIEEISKDTL